MNLAQLAEDKKNYPPHIIRTIVEICCELGISSQQVLSGTGLKLSDLQHPGTPSSMKQFFRVAHNAIQASQLPGFGLQVGRRMHLSSYGMNYFLINASTFRNGCQLAANLHREASPRFAPQFLVESNYSSWVFPNREAVTIQSMTDTLYQFLIDFHFATHVTSIQENMGNWFLPTQAQFTQPEPSYASVLEELLCCTILYKQKRNALSYPIEWLDTPTLLSDPVTSMQISRHCARLMNNVDRSSTYSLRVHQELMNSQENFPSIEDIANTLCITSRTLRRKLASEGTSYTEIYSQVRKSLAFDYLMTTNLSIEEIAQSLGFSDVVGFRHAFKKWTGFTPNEYRHNPEKIIEYSESA